MAVKKAKRKIKLGDISTRAMGLAVVKYREMRKAGQVPAIAVLDKLSNFYGRKGQVLKRETRYQTQLTQLQELISAARTELGSKTPGRAAIMRRGEKAKERILKGAKGYAKNEGAIDNRFKRIAREKTNEYYKMSQVFASSTYDKLKNDSYGIGSGVVQALIQQGWDEESAIKFLEQIKDAWDRDIPKAARDLGSNDEMWQNILKITDTIKQGGIEAEEFKAIFKGYIAADDASEFNAALQNYIESDTDHTFAEIWTELKQYNDIASQKNMDEVIEELDERRAKK